MIQILDNFLSETEINQIYKLLSSPEMSWFIVNDRDNSKIKNKSFGKKVGPEILRDDFYLNYLHNKIKSKNIPNTNNLYQIYFNCVKPGDKFDYHQDCDGTSVLLYCNPTWRSWWGSGTQFKKPRKIVRPKPGRAIAFDGNIEHRCISPNYLMKDYGRLSIVFQFKK